MKIKSENAIIKEINNLKKELKILLEDKNICDSFIAFQNLHRYTVIISKIEALEWVINA